MGIINNFNNFLVEKTGVNDDIENFSLLLYNYIHNQISKGKDYFFFPTNKIPENIVNYRKVKFFKIVISSKSIMGGGNGAIDIEKDENNNIEVILFFKYNKLHIVEHEILHLYQSCRRKTIETKNDKIFYRMSKIDSYFNNHNRLIRILNSYIYLSLDSEIDARTQEVYRKLKKDNVNKINFVDKIKNTDEYEISQILIDSWIIKRIRKKNIVNFVSHWLFFYKNKEILTKENNLKKLNNLYFNYIGPIKKPKIVKKYPVIDDLTKNILYEEVSEKYAEDFINKWEKTFKKQGEKFKRKLIKLYNNL